MASIYLYTYHFILGLEIDWKVLIGEMYRQGCLPPIKSSEYIPRYLSLRCRESRKPFISINCHLNVIVYLYYFIDRWWHEVSLIIFALSAGNGFVASHNCLRQCCFFNTGDPWTLKTTSQKLIDIHKHMSNYYIVYFAYTNQWASTSNAIVCYIKQSNSFELTIFRIS